MILRATYLGSIDDLKIFVLLHELIHTNGESVNCDIIFYDMTHKSVLNKISKPM